jgi:type II secretory pathway component GspD/PulD (secretin)
MKHLLRIAFAAGAMLLPLGGAFAQSENARVTISQEDIPLSAVVNRIRTASGANILIKTPDGEKPIGDIRIERMQVDNAPWRKTLDLAAELAGCVVEEGELGILFVTRPTRVGFMMKDTDIREVIDLIGKMSGANIVVAPEVSGTISIRFNDVPWRDALEVAVKTLGYTVVEEARGILRVVDPLSLKAQMETRAYHLKYVRPPRTWVPVISSQFVDGGKKPPTGDIKKDFPLLDALKSVLSEGAELDYVQISNTLLIRDTVQMHARVSEILEGIDVEPAQVFIDVKFVSTSNSDLYDLGVDYGDSGLGISASGGQIPITFPFDLGNGGFEDILIANDSGDGPFSNPDLNAGETTIPDTIFGALSFTQVAATLRMMQRDTSTEIVQAPKLIAMDGKQATIFVGETIRYAEAKTEQGQAGGLSLSVVEAQSSPVEVGFQLLLEPHVVPDTNKIMLDVIPKETSLSGTGDSSLAPAGFDVFTLGASGLEGSIALPRKRSSTIVTSMLLESGQTAVIGGLSTDTTLESESRIPLLASIPVLGKLFQYETSTQERRSLVVFITPTLLRSSEDSAMLLERELEERRRAVEDGLMDLLEEDLGLTRHRISDDD